MSERLDLMLAFYQRIASFPFYSLNAISVTDSFLSLLNSLFLSTDKQSLSLFTPRLLSLPLQIADLKGQPCSPPFQPSQKITPLFSTCSHPSPNHPPPTPHDLPVCTTLSRISPISPSTSGGFFTWQVYVPLSSNCSFHRMMETSYRSGFPSQTTRSLKRPLMGLKGSTWQQNTQKAEAAKSLLQYVGKEAEVELARLTAPSAALCLESPALRASGWLSR